MVFWAKTWNVVKKILGLVAAIVMACVIIAFILIGVAGVWSVFDKSFEASSPEAKAEDKPTYILGVSESAWVWVDPVTGCHYLSKNSSSASFIYRLDSDGETVMGCKEAKKK